MISKESEAASSSISSQKLAAHLKVSQIDLLALYVHQHQSPDNEKQIAPEADHARLLAQAHGEAHFGVNAMVNVLYLQGLTWYKLKDACL